MSKFLDILTHVFLPNRCMFCKKPIEYDKLICDDCNKNVPFTDLSKCLICGKSECTCENYFRYLLAPFYYELGADVAIRDLKFNNNLHNAKKLAICMTNCIVKTSLDKKVDIIIPVPLHKDDYSTRGFNQAYELSKEISKHINKPIYDNILIKIKKTKKQHNLSAKERYINLIDAFKVKNKNNYKNNIMDKTILLIDDVYTTGSTMNACSKALIESGAKEIICLVVAKTKNMEN